MPYERQDKRLLGGSLNLRPDLSEIPKSHSLELTNCRPDKLGQVISRKGVSAVNAGTPVNADLHTMAQRPGTAGLYLGSGAALHRDNGGTSLSTGFDGNPLGVAVQNGWLWVMNRSQQKKDNGTNFYNWIPAAPGSAPSVAAGSQDTVSVATFHNTETTWNVTDNEDIDVGPTATPPAAKYPNEATTPVVHFDSSTKQDASTDSLRIYAQYAGNWEATKTFGSPTSLAVDGGQRDSDRFRFYLLTIDPDAIIGLSVAVDVNAGDFTTDYYVADVPVAALSLSKLVWNQINLVRSTADARQLLNDDPAYRAIQQQIQEVRERIEANPTGSTAADQFELERLQDELQRASERVRAESTGFRRIGATSGKDWSTVKAVRFSFNLARPTYVWFDEATMFGGVNASFEGAVQYRVTFDTADGHESDPSPASTAVTLSRQGGVLSSIPTSADAQVTKRHIYRGGGTLGAFYRVHTLNDNSTTGWTDNVSDDEATTNPTILETDHDDPPAASGLAGPFFGRLIAFSTAANPNRFWWTKTNRPWYFPSTNFNDVGEKNSEIVAVTRHNRILVFYKTGEIWTLAGDPDINGTLEQSDAVVGALGPRAVASAGAVDYLAGPDGIYEFNMHRARKISQDIDPIFQGQATVIGSGISIPPISGTAAVRARTVVTYAKGFVRVQYAEDGQTYPNIELMYDPETAQWSQNKYNLTLGGFRSMLYDPSTNTLYGGQRNGVFYTLDDTDADAGSAMLVEYQSGFDDQGSPDREKLYEDLAVTYDTGGDSITLEALVDDGETVYSIGTLTNNGRDRKVYPINTSAAAQGRKGRNLAVRINGNSDSGLKVYDLTLHYRVLPRRSRAYDSGELDFGTRKLKRVTALEVDIEVEDTNALSYEILSDFPGRKIASRVSTTKAIGSTGRHRLYIELGTPVQGSLFRLLLSRTTEYYLHAVRLAVLPYGVHVDGDAGEDWETEELELAV